MITTELPYTIVYSNHFYFEGKTFAFRKKYLFDITDLPLYKEILYNNGSKGIWVNRKWLSLSKMQQLIIKKPIIKDVTKLQWYLQEQLNHCFNLI